MHAWYNSHINVGNLDDFDNILDGLLLSTIFIQGAFILAAAP